MWKSLINHRYFWNRTTSVLFRIKDENYEWHTNLLERTEITLPLWIEYQRHSWCKLLTPIPDGVALESQIRSLNDHVNGSTTQSLETGTPGRRQYRPDTPWQDALTSGSTHIPGVKSHTKLSDTMSSLSVFTPVPDASCRIFTGTYWPQRSLQLSTKTVSGNPNARLA